MNTKLFLVSLGGFTFLLCIFSVVIGLTRQPSTSSQKTKSTIATLLPVATAAISQITPTTAAIPNHRVVPIATPTLTTNIHPTTVPKHPTIIPHPTATPTITLKKTIKLLPLGDSITYLNGGYRTELWKWLVQGDGDKIDFVGSLMSGPTQLGDLDNEGHIGWTIAELDVYAFNWMRLYQPDIVLIHTGTNDLNHGVSAPVMTQSLIKLIGDIYAGKPDTYVVVSSLIPTTHGDQQAWTDFNASIPGIATIYQGQGRKIIAIDMSHALTTSDLYDGLHPNEIGMSKMASMWYPSVTKIYKESLH